MHGFRRGQAQHREPRQPRTAPRGRPPPRSRRRPETSITALSTAPLVAVADAYSQDRRSTAQESGIAYRASMLCILLICEDSGQRAEICQQLVAGGHAAELASSWTCDENRCGRDVDAVVVHLPGDPNAGCSLAKLTLQRALLPVPLLTIVEEPFPPSLHLQPLPPGIEALSQSGLLRRLTALQISLAATRGSQAEETLAAQLLDAGYSQDGRDPSTMLAIDSWTGPASPRRPASQSAAGALNDAPMAGGTMLGKYRIDALLGSGTFAHVYRAHHLVLDMPVAIKVLKPSLATAPQVVEHFCSEARSAIRISHPNVVRIHDLTHSPESTFLVMEWIDGISLNDIISTTGRLHPNEVLRVAIAICSALEAAAMVDIIHRDIKPANILIDQLGVVKLVDFGLARHLHDRTVSPISDRVVGTPVYMAPEQAFAPETVDCRSDIYALGATLFHACVGAPPFTSEDTLQMLTLHRDEPVPDISYLVPDCPTELADLIKQMLAKDPANRPHSHLDLLESLQSILYVMTRRGENVNNGWSNIYLRPVQLAHLDGSHP